MYQSESYAIFGFATDIYWHQLDIDQRCVSQSTSTCTFQIVVEVHYLESQGHPHCRVSTFMESSNESWWLKWPQMLELSIHCIDYQAIPHNLTHRHATRITFSMTPFTVFCAKSNACMKTNLTTFIVGWCIYGNLLHLDKCMVSVNVTTHHKCINGKSCNI